MAVDAVVETPVASSATGTQQTDTGGDVLSQMNGDELASWKSSGKVPERLSPQPDKKAAATDDKTPTSSADATPAKKAEPAVKPAPATGKNEGGDKEELTPAEQRIKDLLARTKQLEEENSTLKTPRAAPVQPKADATPVKTEPTEVQEPLAENFEDIDKFIAAKVSYEVKKGIAAERQQQTAEQVRTQQEKTLQEGIAKWQERAAAARLAHGDFDTVALAKDVPVPAGSTLDRWLFASEHGAEMLYHLAQHRDELAVINKASDIDAARLLANLEQKLAPVGKAKVKEDATEKPKDPPRVSNAPPPPSEVRAQATPTDDPIAEAINGGDAGSYIREMNKRERGSRR